MQIIAPEKYQKHEVDYCNNMRISWSWQLLIKINTNARYTGRFPWELLFEAEVQLCLTPELWRGYFIPGSIFVLLTHLLFNFSLWEGTVVIISLWNPKWITAIAELGGRRRNIYWNTWHVRFVIFTQGQY